MGVVLLILRLFDVTPDAFFISSFRFRFILHTRFEEDFLSKFITIIASPNHNGRHVDFINISRSFLLDLDCSPDDDIVSVFMTALFKDSSFGRDFLDRSDLYKLLSHAVLVLHEEA